MIKFILRLLINTLSVYIASRVVPGIDISDLSTALIFAVVLGVLNALIRPILMILTLPVNILTLGLFSLVVNGFIILLAASFVDGVHIQSFFSAVIFSIVLSLVGWFLGLLAI